MPATGALPGHWRHVLQCRPTLCDPSPTTGSLADGYSDGCSTTTASASRYLQRVQILKARLNCDFIGFHNFDYASRFLSCCSRMLGLQYQSKRGYISLDYFGRTVSIKIMPVGIHMGQLQSVLHLPDREWRVNELRQQFEGKTVLLDVDDMDISSYGPSPPTLSNPDAIQSIPSPLARNRGVAALPLLESLAFTPTSCAPSFSSLSSSSFSTSSATGLYTEKGGMVSKEGCDTRREEEEQHFMDGRWSSEWSERMQWRLPSERVLRMPRDGLNNAKDQLQAASIVKDHSQAASP